MTVADFAHSEEGRRKLLPFRSLTGTSLVTAAKTTPMPAMLKGSFANASPLPSFPLRRPGGTWAGRTPRRDRAPSLSTPPPPSPLSPGGRGGRGCEVGRHFGATLPKLWLHIKVEVKTRGTPHGSWPGYRLAFLKDELLLSCLCDGQSLAKVSSSEDFQIVVQMILVLVCLRFSCTTTTKSTNLKL